MYIKSPCSNPISGCSLENADRDLLARCAAGTKEHFNVSRFDRQRENFEKRLWVSEGVSSLARELALQSEYDYNHNEAQPELKRIVEGYPMTDFFPKANASVNTANRKGSNYTPVGSLDLIDMFLARIANGAARWDSLKSIRGCAF